MKKDRKVIDYYERYVEYVKKQQSGIKLSEEEVKQAIKLEQWLANDKKKMAQFKEDKR